MKGFKHFGVMIDMSRNSVMNLPSLKNYISILKKIGYDTVMLYTEDTYEIDGDPYFGYMRGRYSKDEMKEIDEYASSIGIEIIPCIQTLAHLNAFVRWGTVPLDIDDVLLVDNEKTYEFIEKLFKSVSECFKSRNIHIGMDEAWKLGRGRHLDDYGLEPTVEIMKRHLARVCEIAKKYGYKPMLWSDMFIRSWNKNNYYIPRTEIPEFAKNSIPDGVAAVYWDYYHLKESEYDDNIYNHRQLCKDLWFAGGCWSWSGLAPQNRFSLDTMLPAMRSCRKNKIKNVFFTLWGDDGGECSHFSQLPALFYLAEFARGNEDDALIKEKFEKRFGLSFDDFIKLDLPNAVCENIGRRNPSKYMLYSDLFNGFLDYTVSEGVGEKYAAYEKELAEIARKTRKYGYLFDTEAKLCRVLKYKYELGLKTRNAYRSGNKEELLKLAKVDYTEVISALRAFHKTYMKQWLKENKGSGFDVQDLRIGGIILRAESCKTRLIDYVNGKCDRIEELECELLPFNAKIPRGEPISLNNYKLYASANVTSN